VVFAPAETAPRDGRADRDGEVKCFFL